MYIKLFLKSIIISIISFSLAYGFFQLSKAEFEIDTKHFWSMLPIKNNLKTYNQSISLRDIDEISIDSTNSDISIEPTLHPDGAVNITADASINPNIIFEKNNHSLTVRFTNQGSDADAIITIKTPNSVKRLNIRNTSGDVNIHAKIKTLDIKTVSGDITLLDTVETPEYSLSTVSGDITITASSAFNARLEARSISGDVMQNPWIAKPTLTSNAGYINSNTVSGDIVIR